MNKKTQPNECKKETVKQVVETDQSQTKAASTSGKTDIVF